MNANDLFAAAPQRMKKRTATLAIASSLETDPRWARGDPRLQINGCANCINMPTADARAKLSAWPEAPCDTDRERAALGWTEALTLVSETRAPDDAYEALRRYFSEEEQVKLTLLIGLVNAWNRINIGFRAVHPAEAKNAA